MKQVLNEIGDIADEQELLGKSVRNAKQKGDDGLAMDIDSYADKQITKINIRIKAFYKYHTAYC